MVRKARSTRAKPRSPRNPRSSGKTKRGAHSIATVQVQELESIRAEVERLAQRTATPRWNADPEDVRRSVAKLVLTLVEFIRQLLERHERLLHASSRGSPAHCSRGMPHPRLP